MSKKSKKKDPVEKTPLSYQEIRQTIHSAQDEIARRKWEEVLKFLLERDRCKEKGLPFPPKKS